MPICELRNVTKAYGSGPARVLALDHVSLDIEAGEFTVFCGPSGSGKTTWIGPKRASCFSKARPSARAAPPSSRGCARTRSASSSSRST